MSATVRADIGPVITGADVERAVLDTLKLWLESYLRECEHRRGEPVGALPAPRGWLVTGRGLEKFTSDQLPCVIVMSGGIVVKPTPHAYPGALTCVWHLDVGTIWNAAWGTLSREHAQLMVRAMTLTLLQRPLGDLAAVVDFTGERYDELDFAETRTYSAAVAQFTVEVEEALWRDGGPPPFATPGEPASPFDPLTVVTETGVTVEQLPLTQRRLRNE
jgi:hypothetical protein